MMAQTIKRMICPLQSRAKASHAMVAHIGKVEAGELSEIFSGGYVVGNRCRNLRIEKPEAYLFPINFYRCLPFAVRRVEVCPLQFTGRGAHVAHVLERSADSEIFAPIIEPVVINVVNEQILRRAQQFAVKISFFAPIASEHIRRTLCPANAPAELRDKIEIFGINNGS